MSSSQRNLVLGAAAGAILVLAVVLYVSRTGGRTALPAEFRIEGVCLACKNNVQIEHRPSEIAPFVCPECGQQAVYNWWYCDDCAKRFVPRLVRWPDDPWPREPPIPTCPLCGKSNVAGYVSGDPGQQPVSDAPLPAWPIK